MYKYFIHRIARECPPRHKVEMNGTVVQNLQLIMKAQFHNSKGETKYEMLATRLSLPCSRRMTMSYPEHLSFQLPILVEPLFRVEFHTSSLWSVTTSNFLSKRKGQKCSTPLSQATLAPMSYTWTLGDIASSSRRIRVDLPK